jgi:hypothetical protein
VSGGEGRRFCGSVCGKEFFFPFSPFSYVKSAQKLGSSLQSQQCFLGEGREGAQTWHPSLGLKVASYCLETCVSV